ncbi:hypothetical protein F-LCD7_0472 [Faustovirus]|nr:hypothetical protein F-LCD7_0472 [Faustovirus]
MSTYKVNTLLNRVISTGVSSRVKVNKTWFKDIKITLDGFDDKPVLDNKTSELIDISQKAKAIAVIRQIKYIIISLARGSWDQANNGEIVMRETMSRGSLIATTEKVNVITWSDICDCLYDYVSDDNNCVVKIQADIRLHPNAQPKIEIEIVFDAERDGFFIYIGGRTATLRGLQTSFAVDASQFYKTDYDGEIIHQSREDIDNEMDTFFKSRSISSDEIGSDTSIGSSVGSVSSIISNSSSM